MALVTGATRGAGRGTAVSLGEAGATVYCTGRTTRERRSEYDRPETIEETAELVDAAGGTGVAVAVDDLEANQVKALVRSIEVESGRLDILVNDIWGGERLFEWNTPVWEHDLENGLRMLRLAIDTHLITSHFALPLLIREQGGLVVEMTDGTREYNAEHYRNSAFYDLTKTAVLRLCLRAGRGARPTRMYGCSADARVDAVGDDARELRGHRGELARRSGHQSALRRDLRKPAVRGPRVRFTRRRPGPRSPQRRLVWPGGRCRVPPDRRVVPGPGFSRRADRV